MLYTLVKMTVKCTKGTIFKNIDSFIYTVVNWHKTQNCYEKRSINYIMCRIHEEIYATRILLSSKFTANTTNYRKCCKVEKQHVLHKYMNLF